MLSSVPKNKRNLCIKYHLTTWKFMKHGGKHVRFILLLMQSLNIVLNFITMMNTTNTWTRKIWHLCEPSCKSYRKMASHLNVVPEISHFLGDSPARITWPQPSPFIKNSTIIFEIIGITPKPSLRRAFKQCTYGREPERSVCVCRVPGAGGTDGTPG